MNPPASGPVLAALPETFGATRAALHRVAEHVIAPARHAATGRIGLRATAGGFGTPPSDGHQLRVDRGVFVVDEVRHPLSTLRAAADAAGAAVGARTGVYEPTTDDDPDAPLDVDADAAAVLGDWYAYCDGLLEQLRHDADAAGESPAIVQLWPEHFDIAMDLGADGKRANYGGSPGDAEHSEPYLYVGPWERPLGDDPFWNEPFGASLSYSAIREGADGLAFFRQGREML